MIEGIKYVDKDRTCDKRRDGVRVTERERERELETERDRDRERARDQEREREMDRAESLEASPARLIPCAWSGLPYRQGMATAVVAGMMSKNLGVCQPQALQSSTKDQELEQ